MPDQIARIFQPNFFTNLSIRLKLTVIIFFAIFFSLLAELSVVTYFDVQEIKRYDIEQTRIANQVLSQDLAKLLIFDSPEIGADLVSRLSAFNDIQYAAIFNVAEQRIFQFSKHKNIIHTMPSLLKQGVAQAENGYHIFEPIAYGTKKLGTAYYYVISNKVTEKLNDYVIAIAIIIPTFAFIALILAMLIQHPFTKPVEQLLETILRVIKTDDFTIRSHSLQKNEFGALTRTLNQLFEHVFTARESASNAQNKLEIYNQKLHYQATHDLLTDLINRHEFERLVKNAIESSKINNVEHALLYLDLDQFKVINDTCGHVAGDIMLSRIAGVLTQSIRSNDTLARLGGDEFGILLEQCPLDKATEIANGITDDVSKHEFTWKSHTFSVGVSIGLAIIDNQCESFTSLLRNADSSCFAAKDQGRNRIHLFSEDSDEEQQRYGELTWASKIRKAVSDDRLCLYRQKIINIENPSEKQHFEILVRMIDDNGDIISPGIFVPAAERFDLMSVIDDWVLEHVFMWLTAKKNRINDIHIVSINISGNSFTRDDFATKVISQIEKYQLPFEKICLEITESASIANYNKAISFIEKLHNRGCHFALDDFGIGLSSFAYLRDMPADTVKIDGSFIKNIVHSKTDLSLVRSINDIAHTLGKLTVAEFVETQEILDQLKIIGVDYAQGYGITKPEPLT